MKLRNKISTKLWVGFGFLLSSIVVICVLTYSISTKVFRLSDRVENVLFPTVIYLQEIHTDLSKSQELISTWLKNSNEEIFQKRELTLIHNESYPLASKKLKRVALKRGGSYFNKIDSLIRNTDKIIEAQHSIIIKYDEAEAYNTLTSKTELPQLILSFSGGAKFDETQGVLKELEKEINAAKNEYASQTLERRLMLKSMRNLVILIGLLFFVIGSILAYYISNSIVAPVIRLKTLLKTMGRGVLPSVNVSTQKDEMGEINTALSNFVEGLKSIVGFSRSIGAGDFNTDFTPLSKDDSLGNNLLIMRDNLKLVSEEDRKRNWTTGGLAKFSELLREESDNVSSLTEKLIAELVAYLKANQGGVFVLEGQEDTAYMCLKSCYAWDRRKFIDQQIYLGDGLVGQSWLEQDVLYLTDVPADYIKITSGLGKALPKSLLIVPMISNDQVYGVIEIASFNEFQEHEIEFVKRLAESTAATIASASVNERTKVLLEQTQVNTKQLRKHEEDLVFNQQEMKKNQKLLGNEIEALRKKVTELNNKSELLKDENDTMSMLILKYKKQLDAKTSS